MCLCLLCSTVIVGTVCVTQAVYSTVQYSWPSVGRRRHWHPWCLALDLRTPVTQLPMPRTQHTHKSSTVDECIILGAPSLGDATNCLWYMALWAGDIDSNLTCILL